MQKKLKVCLVCIDEWFHAPFTALYERFWLFSIAIFCALFLRPFVRHSFRASYFLCLCLYPSFFIHISKNCIYISLSFFAKAILLLRMSNQTEGRLVSNRLLYFSMLLSLCCLLSLLLPLCLSLSLSLSLSTLVFPLCLALFRAIILPSLGFIGFKLNQRYQYQVIILQTPALSLFLVYVLSTLSISMSKGSRKKIKFFYQWPGYLGLIPPPSSLVATFIGDFFFSSFKKVFFPQCSGP